MVVYTYDVRNQEVEDECQTHRKTVDKTKGRKEGKGENL